MVKRVIIVHGWEGHPEHGWKPWLKQKLEKKGFAVYNPQMPNTNHPKMSSWIKHIAKFVGKPDEDCYLVGHSLGCIAILRYLETLKPGQKIGGAILVAGFTSDLGFKELTGFFKVPIKFEKIKEKSKNFIAVHSDNDPYVSLHYRKFFKDCLGAKIITKHNMRHFSGSDGIIKLPVVYQELVRISK